MFHECELTLLSLVSTYFVEYNQLLICLLFILVQSRIFELIGGFAKDYPDCIENEVDEGVKIRDMYFQTMEKAVVGQQEVIIK